VAGRRDHDVFDRNALQVGELLTERVSFGRDPAEDAVGRFQLLHYQTQLTVEGTHSVLFARLARLPSCSRSLLLLLLRRRHGTNARLAVLARLTTGHHFCRCRAGVGWSDRNAGQLRIRSIHRRHTRTSLGLTDRKLIETRSLPPDYEPPSAARTLSARHLHPVTSLRACTRRDLALLAQFDLTKDPVYEQDWRKTDVSGQNLRGATFESCDFRDVNFAGADLTNTTFEDCQFAGANPETASSLEGAVFQVTGLSKEQRAACAARGATMEALDDEEDD
jgi:hypothetical protein